MIYLRQTKGDKISASRETRKRGECPGAVYHYKTDRITILKLDDYIPDVIGTINHEFMHRILEKNHMSSAANKWDCDFIIEKVEVRLGWWKPLPGEMLIHKIVRIFRS